MFITNDQITKAGVRVLRRSNGWSCVKDFISNLKLNMLNQVKPLDTCKITWIANRTPLPNEIKGRFSCLPIPRDYASYSCFSLLAQHQWPTRASHGMSWGQRDLHRLHVDCRLPLRGSLIPPRINSVNCLCINCLNIDCQLLIPLH